MDYIPLNWDIIASPVNWAIVILMLLIAGFVLHLMLPNVPINFNRAPQF